MRKLSAKLGRTRDAKVTGLCWLSNAACCFPGENVSLKCQTDIISLKQMELDSKMRQQGYIIYENINQKSFMDVRITHPNATFNMTTPVDKYFLRNKTEKKTKYGSRIINTERATLILPCFCYSSLKRLADLQQHNEQCKHHLLVSRCDPF